LDAISSLLGICLERTYEGEPAMKLEAAAKGSLLRMEPPEIRGSVIDTSEFIERLLGAEGRKEDLAYTSIYLLGYSLGELSSKYLSRSDYDAVFVSGGAAVNSILIKGIEDSLKGFKVKVKLNSMVPAGDGGIALGQVASMLWRDLDEITDLSEER